MRIKAGFVDGIEESGEAVVVAGRDGVVLVVVAAGAFEGESEEGGAHGVDAIRDVFGAEFLIDAATLVGLAMEPVEGGGQDLITGRIGQEISRQLPGDEPIPGADSR
jgi:hypothetical protein